MNHKNSCREISVGVDTGKKQLDIYIRPLDIYFTVSNDDEGIKKAIKTIKIHSPTPIIIEATGRLEHAFVLACSKSNLPFVLANPMHIKRFAGAIGQLAKTDKLDAKLIAHYGESIKPILTSIKNQLEKVDNKLHNLIEQCDEYKTKKNIVQSMPGIGDVVTFSLLSNMPELGYITNKKAAALIGVAPMNRESGVYQGHRKIRGGRHQIRTVMYMAMKSAMQCNPVFKAMYQRLVAAGKAKKMSIIACVRKMIVILNSMVRDGVMWDAKFAEKNAC